MLNFDEVDAFITEHDGECIHVWAKSSRDAGDCWEYRCTGCNNPWYLYKNQTEDELPTIDNPVARDLGKLFDLAVKHHIKTESIHSYYYGKGIQAYLYSKVVIKCYFKNYNTPQLAYCTALGNAIVQVLKEQK